MLAEPTATPSEASSRSGGHRILFLCPPLLKPCEPGLSAAAAAQCMRALGVDADFVDASMAYHQFALSREAMEKVDHVEGQRAQRKDQAPSQALNQAFNQAIRHGAGMEALKNPATYADRRVYSSAVNHLVQGLKLIGKPFPGWHFRVGDVEIEGRRAQDSRDLWAVAQNETPFDDYYLQKLIPYILNQGYTHIGISLSFLHQGFAAFRLAFLLEQHLPKITRLLGGPLLSCWHAAGCNLDSEPFQLFHQLFRHSSPEELQGLAQSLKDSDTPPAALPRLLLAPDLSETPYDQYLSPMPTLPMTCVRGCYWRACAFCPDHLHPAYERCPNAGIEAFLEAVAARFPKGAMLHLTDSALSPSLLDTLATLIQKNRYPFKWHGFARLERNFEAPDFMRHLKAGGCAMLQWGLESASNPMLERMNKGVSVEQSRRVLRSSHQAGIQNHAYLLFGLPLEEDADREATLRFIQEEGHCLQSLNASLLNLPRQSPMHLHPERYGITRFSSFGEEADLSLYLDFYCGERHPRLEARRWLSSVFLKDESVKKIMGNLNDPFKENHGCFLKNL